MRIVRQLAFSAVFVFLAASVPAAPVESVESARASAAYQKLDAFLGEQLVVDRLAALGVTVEQARARLAALSDAQLEQLAAQVELLQAGGKIQGGRGFRLGPVGCMLHQLHSLFDHVMRFLFCWDDVR